MFFGDIARALVEFEGTEGEAFALETRDDLADKTTLDSCGIM